MSTPSTPAPTPATPAAASSVPARSSKPESAPKIASATTTKPVETVPAPAPATKKGPVAREAAAAKPAKAPAPVAAKEVKAKKPIKFSYEPINIRGRLELIPKDMDTEVFYRLHDAVIEN